jgi:GDPmannose 4,6-dehydratase
MSDDTKKVIVTGITGQDGSYMVDHLLDNTDYKIYGMVRRSSNLNTTNIFHFQNHSRFELITGDLSDSQSIDNIVREIKPDYFINLAAQSFVGSSWQIPEQTFDVDAMGPLRCLEAIRKHAPNCRFYNAGSSEELGDVDYSPQDEKHPLKPRSPYGAAKAAARHIVKVYRESYNLFAIQGLLYNHESERRGEEFVTRKITKGVARIKNCIDKNLPFTPIELGNIDAKRDWSHAADFVDGIWKMLNQDNPIEHLLSSGETHTVREFVELAFLEAGIEGNWNLVNGTEAINEEFLAPIGDSIASLVKISKDFYRPAEVDILWGDSSEARFKLAWLPKISFRDLIRRMVSHDIFIEKSLK